MSKIDKFLNKLLLGKSDNNLKFNDLDRLLLSLGFTGKIKGSHHIFTKDGIEEIINLQPVGNLAKPYQIKQVRNIILKYQLGEFENE